MALTIPVRSLPARSITETLLASLVDASRAEPFVGPDQAAFAQMLAQMTAAPVAS